MAIAIGLLKTLLELSRARKSGVIDAAVSGARVRLFVEGGEIVAADEGTVGETLGRLLVREKVLSEDQYSAAIEWMADLRARGKNARLGEVFVELKMLTPQQVHAALSAQVQQKAVRALSWKNAHPTFVECHGPLEIGDRYPTAIEPLVLAALRLAQLDEVEALFEQARGRYIEVVEPERLSAFELHAKEQVFAQSLDGSRTAAELLAAPDASEPAVVLAALLLFDCLALHSHTQAPRRPTIPRPPPNIRRVSSSGSAADVPPPAASSARGLRAPAPKEKKRIKTVAARLRAAQSAKRTLAMPPADAQYELAIPTPQTPVAPVARLLAEKAFQAGKNLVRANDLPKALAELRRATVMFPAAEYELWACWAAMRVEGPSIERIDELRRTAERALVQDPRLAFGWFVLGHLAMRDRDTTRANELFARARALEPATVDELRDVRLRDAQPAASATTTSKMVAPPPRPAVPRPAPSDPALRALRPARLAEDDVGENITAKSPIARVDLKPAGLAMPPRAPKSAPKLPALRPAKRVEQKPPDAEAKAKAEEAIARSIAMFGGRSQDAPVSTRPKSVPPPLPPEAHALVRPKSVPPPLPAWAAAPGATEPKPASDRAADADALDAAWDDAAAGPDVPTTDRSPSTEALAAKNETEETSRDAREEEVTARRPKEEAPIADPVAPEQEDESPRDDGVPPTEPSAPDMRKSVVPKEPAASKTASIPPREGPRVSMPSWRAIAGAAAVAAIAVWIAWARGTFEPPVGPPVARVEPEPSASASTSEPATSDEAAPAFAVGEEDADIDATAEDAEVDAEADASVDASDEAAVVVAPSDTALLDAATDTSVTAVEVEDAEVEAAIPSTMGLLTFPAAADTHRVWVDGRFVGAPPAPIVVPCGKRVVKVGSAGRDQEVDVPCGGRLPIEYP